MTVVPGPFDLRGRPLRPRRWDIALVVAAGGAIGGAARFGLSEAWRSEPGSFPWATFTSNVAGCLLLAALLVVLLEVAPPRRYVRPFLGVGVLGGFTTFSAYTNEARELLSSDNGDVALTYLVATLVAGLTATWLGLALTRAATGALRADRRPR